VNDGHHTDATNNDAPDNDATKNDPDATALESETS
jgi:hypothetical protein